MNLVAIQKLNMVLFNEKDLPIRRCLSRINFHSALTSGHLQVHQSNGVCQLTNLLRKVLDILFPRSNSKEKLAVLLLDALIYIWGHMVRIQVLPPKAHCMLNHADILLTFSA